MDIDIKESPATDEVDGAPINYEWTAYYQPDASTAPLRIYPNGFGDGFYAVNDETDEIVDVSVRELRIADADGRMSYGSDEDRREFNQALLEIQINNSKSRRAVKKTKKIVAGGAFAVACLAAGVVAVIAHRK